MNAGRLQFPFGQEGGGEVPEPLDGDEFGHGRNANTSTCDQVFRPAAFATMKPFLPKRALSSVG